MRYPQEDDVVPRGWNGDVYRCADGMQITCKRKTVRNEQMGMRSVPRNGIQATPRHVSVLAGNVASRRMSIVVLENYGKTYVFPRTVKTIIPQRVSRPNRLVSIRFGEDLQRLPRAWFERFAIRRLVLPASVSSIDGSTFVGSDSLRCVDLRSALGLRSIGSRAFCECGRLDRVFLNDGLEMIGQECFSDTAIEEVTIPRSVRLIGSHAFYHCSLLKRVSFEDGAPTTIEPFTFAGSGLQSFTALRSLRQL